MGNQLNTTVITTDEVQTTINNITLNITQGCTDNTVVVQSLTIEGNNNFISDLLEQQSVQSSLQCFTSSTNQISLANQLGVSLANQAQTNAGLVFGLAINTNVITNNVTQDIVTNNMITVIQQCSTLFDISQTVFVGGDYNKIVNATLSQQGISFSKCVFGSNNMDQISNNIASNINNASNISTSAFSNFLSVIIIAAVIIAVGAVVAAVASRSRNRADPDGSLRKENKRLKDQQKMQQEQERKRQKEQQLRLQNQQARLQLQREQLQRPLPNTPSVSGKPPTGTAYAQAVNSGKIPPYTSAPKFAPPKP